MSLQADPLIDSASVVQVRIFENQKLNGRSRGWSHVNVSPSDFHGKPFLLNPAGRDDDEGVGLYRYTDEAGARALGTLRLDAVRPKEGFEWVSPWHILKGRGKSGSPPGPEEGFVYGPSFDELKLSFFRKLNSDAEVPGTYIARRRLWIREMVICSFPNVHIPFDTLCCVVIRRRKSTCLTLLCWRRAFCYRTHFK